MFVLQKKYAMKKTNLTAKCIFVIACAMLFIACIKNADTPRDDNDNSGDYYLKCKIDGIETNFNYLPQAFFNLSDADTFYSTSLVAYKAKPMINDTSNFVILMADNKPMVKNVVYTNYGASGGNTQRIKLNALTQLDKGTFYASWGDEFASFGIVSDTKVEFTEVGDKHLKGTFSGTMYQQIDGSSPKHVVTDGEFYVQKLN